MNPRKYLPGSSADENLLANARDPSLIPGLGRSPGGGNGYPFQYSCLENPMDRGAWWATVHANLEGLPIITILQMRKMTLEYHPSLRSIHGSVGGQTVYLDQTC